MLVQRHSSSQKVPSTSGRKEVEINRISVPIFLTDIQFAPHTTHEQPFTPQTNGLGSNIGEQPHGKPHELTVDLVGDRDSESDAEKGVV